MSATRDDVALWRWGSEHDARAVRGRNISNAMLPPRLTSRWRDLKTADRSLAGVEALEVATPGEEAQAIAIDRKRGGGGKGGAVRVGLGGGRRIKKKNTK